MSVILLYSFKKMLYKSYCINKKIHELLDRRNFTWNKVYIEVRRNYYEKLTGPTLEIPSVLGLFLHGSRWWLQVIDLIIHLTLLRRNQFRRDKEDTHLL